MAKLTTLSSWKNLQAHFNTIEHAQMRDMFKKDEKRFEKFSLEFNNILVDYSKNRITEETLSLLQSLAKERNLKEAIEAMFTGKKINNTENRAVLHLSLIHI